MRILIVDDDEVVRQTLRTIMELEKLEVVGEAASGEEALARLPNTPCDLVMLDVLMPGMGGIVACREIRVHYPEVRVLMLTSNSDDEAVLASLLAGANGYLLKVIQGDELSKAVRLLGEGKSLIDPAVTGAVMQKLLSSQKPRPASAPEAPAGSVGSNDLSEREIEVIELVGRGYTNKQIAEALIIAEKTARNHVARILEKLGLARRSQAATWAAQHGLLSS